MERETIKVLLVDDDQGDFEMTRALLESAERRDFEYELDWVSSYEEGLDALRAADHDVYLLDYFLEDRTGLDLLREVGRQGIGAPVVMLTGRGSRQVDLEAMKAGAHDYLVKGRIDPELLERAIRYALERARSQAALRESEERHRSMFDHLPVGLYRTTPEGEFLDANPALIRMLGYPDRDRLRKSYARSLYVDPGHRDRFLEILERRGVARAFDTRLERVDGTTIRVLNTARLHRSADGEVLYLEGSLEDITDLPGGKGARGEARFRAIFHGSGVPIALLDLDALVGEANPAFCRLLGASPPQVEGRPYSDLLEEEDKIRVIQELASLSRGDMEDDRIEGETRYRGPDGGAVRAHSTLCLVRDAEARPDHLLVLLGEAESGEGG